MQKVTHMVQHGPDVPAAPERVDQIQVQFDDPRSISSAGLLLTASLADRLGVEDLVNESVWLGYENRARRCRDARS